MKMNPESAKVEATHVLNLIKDCNAEILQALIDGKMTVSDARRNSTIEAIKEWKNNVKMKPESANVPTEAPASPKEKQTTVGRVKPPFNQPPLSFEEHAARVEAAEVREAAMKPEELEAAQAPFLQAPGMLTPEEQKERRAALAAREKARIAKLPPEMQAALARDKARGKKLITAEHARLAAKKATLK
jgi:hypothetical protein